MRTSKRSMASARLQSSMSRRKRPARLVHSERTHSNIAPSATASTSLRDTPPPRPPGVKNPVMPTAMAERAPLSRLVGGLALAAVASQLLALALGLPPLGSAFLVDAFFASSMLGAALLAAIELPWRWRLPSVGIGLLLEWLLMLAFPTPPDVTQWVVQR